MIFKNLYKLKIKWQHYGHHQVITCHLFPYGGIIHIIPKHLFSGSLYYEESSGFHRYIQYSALHSRRTHTIGCREKGRNGLRETKKKASSIRPVREQMKTRFTQHCREVANLSEGAPYRTWTCCCVSLHNKFLSICLEFNWGQEINKNKRPKKVPNERF